MKKTLPALSILFLAILVFSSCSNLRNLSIEKRHYGKGYYVHTNGKRVMTNDAKAEEVAAINQSEVTETVIAPVATTVNSNIEAAPVTTSAPVQKPAVAENNAVPKVVAEPVRTVTKNTKAEQTKVVRAASKKAKSTAADDVSLILIIILCFLLPPLAVFLSEGITTNFWIDLILTLLFFLPGIIFALIVCLS